MKYSSRTARLRVATVQIIFAVAWCLTMGVRLAYSQENTPPSKPPEAMHRVPDDFSIPPFPDTPEGKQAKLGRLLITETYSLIGPETRNPITGNHLSCANCHLNAGTKPFAVPYVGLSGVFPLYARRENKVESLEERINGCLERSMNGRPIDVASGEMRAMVTYIKYLSINTPVGKRIEGQGLGPIVLPQRAASPESGAKIYAAQCIACHGEHGQGRVNGNGGYQFPPLWGPDSYNDGAGMNRVITAAKFIKSNMPFGINANNPILTDEEAFDVAAYVNSQSRPVMANKDKDYPDLTKKPKDCPYPPYADSVSQRQHKYGPFDFAKDLQKEQFE